MDGEIEDNIMKMDILMYVWFAKNTKQGHGTKCFRLQMYKYNNSLK